MLKKTSITSIRKAIRTKTEDSLVFSWEEELLRAQIQLFFAISFIIFAHIYVLYLTQTFYFTFTSVRGIAGVAPIRIAIACKRQ